jgi:site-specific DNA-methyltransferase (adenine-specific)
MKINYIQQGDCLDLMKELPDNCIDLIYADPPFATGRDFGVFSDKRKLIEHLKYMKSRLKEMNRILKSTGSLYHHCDPTTSHYMKVVLDKIFGIENFRNEIVWYYKTGGVGKKLFAKKHDILLFYTKTENYIFNPQREMKQLPAIQKAIEKGTEIFEDEYGKWTWHYRPGRNPKYPEGTKEYLESYVRDVWEIPAINAMAKERSGYNTQKPEPLLERVIKTSSNEGDLFIEPFLGSGTGCYIAKKLRRNYIGFDTSKESIDTTNKRLEKLESNMNETK